MLSMYGNSEDFKEYDKALQNIQERCFALEAKNKALVHVLKKCSNTTHIDYALHMTIREVLKEV